MLELTNELNAIKMARWSKNLRDCFLATKGNDIFYVQVADDISKEETLEREKKPTFTYLIQSKTIGG